MAGAAVGLVLAVKHTGLLVLPILFLLTLCEIILNIFGANREKIGRHALKTLRFVGAHHADRLGGPVVLLRISLRRTTKRSANESASG